MGFFRSTFSLLQGKKRGSISKEWMFTTDSEILARPRSFSYKGRKYVVFGTKEGVLYMINEDSDIIWKYRVTKELGKIEELFVNTDSATGIFSMPALLKEGPTSPPTILFGADDFSLYALSFRGTLIWKFTAKDAIRTTALICDINKDGKDEIIIGSSDRNLYLLTTTGELLNSFKARSGIESTAALYPTSTGDLIIFGSNDGYVYAIDTEFEKVWDYKTGGKITAQPVIADLRGDGHSYILIGSSDGNLYVLDSDGALKWKYETEGGIVSKACVADVNGDGKLEILFGSSDDKVYCLTYSGDKIWDFEADFWIVDTPQVVDIDHDGKLEIVVGSLDSTLYVLDGEGAYSLHYMPGISSVTQQHGHYNETLSSEVGEFHAKKIWEIKADGMVISADVIDDCLFIGTKNGKIEKFCYSR